MDTFLDWVLINIPFLCFVILLVTRVIISTKRGLVKEICSIIATIVASVAIILIALAIRKYLDESKLVFVLTLVLISVLGILYKIIDGFLTTIKLIAKLPVLNAFDKLMGLVFGIAETILVVWAVYCIIIILGSGPFEQCVMKCVENNFVMRFMYDNNYLYNIIAPYITVINGIDIASKINF